MKSRTTIKFTIVSIIIACILFVALYFVCKDTYDKITSCFW